ncbi:CPBP family glutamic-type intramembrane protease [Proteinivorax hydrogeniformans]|uniref:CPBP family glutamic-type intramembrane protease n=1 Tax=Proteinivorax hydrogeniformans TaxID=1826727 RepID=A0AAU8HS22_9FIRM
MDAYTFSIKQALNVGFVKVKDNFLQLAQYLFILALAVVTLEFLVKTSSVYSVEYFLRIMRHFLLVLLTFSIIKICFNVYDGKKVQSIDLVNNYKYIPFFLGAILFGFLIMGVMSSFGLLIFAFVLGIFLISRFLFFLHFIIDENKGVFSSFNESWELTTDKGFKLLFFIILACLIMLAPILLGNLTSYILLEILCFFIFVFFALPFGVMTTIFVFRDLKENRSPWAKDYTGKGAKPNRFLVAIRKRKEGTFLDMLWNIIKVLLVFYMSLSLSISFIASVVSWTYRQPTRVDFEVGSILGAIIAFCIYTWMVEKRNKNLFQICRFKKITWQKSIAAFAAGMGFVSLSLVLLRVLGISPPTLNSNEIRTLEHIIILFSGTVIAVLLEEIVFRGFLFGELKEKLPLLVAVVVQAVIFGAMHMSVAQGIYSTILGIGLGLSMIWTGSIWAPILIHAGNNIFSLVSALVFGGLNIYFNVIFIIVVLPLTFGYLFKNKVPQYNDKGKTLDSTMEI